MTDLDLPMVQPLPGLPQQVTIWEVGPRDGLQNESAIISVDVKSEFIRRLVAAGLPVVEATSFVRPEWVPQLADAAEVMATLPKDPSVRFPVLVPNERGLDAARQAGASEIAGFASATETFARKNLNRSLGEQMDMFAPVIEKAQSWGMPVRGYVSMCFGDPWEGAVAPEAVVRVCSELWEAGCSELSLGDTIGVATPGQVHDVIGRLTTFGIPISAIGVHFHDTYGQALANTLAALQSGVTTVDASAGGLGGCPYAKSATGNLATEDLVWQLEGLGVDTGVDLERLVAASDWLSGVLGRPSPSRVVRALTTSS